MKEIGELMEQMEELQSSLEETMEKARECARTARQFKGEIDRVVAGQLESYLIGTLSAFSRDGWQTGNIPGLVKFIEEYSDEEYDEDERPYDSAIGS